MQSAPSVSYPVGRSRIAGRILLVLWLGGAGCAVTAAVHFEGFDWRVGLLLIGVLGAGGAAWASTLRRAPASVLHFDGLGWSMPSVPGMHAAQASVALDGQSSLLVRLSPEHGAGRWVWLDRDAMPERWQALRRAVYSRPASTGPVPAGVGSPASAGLHHPLP